MAVITLYGPKGGVGKTTLALALAFVLSEEARTCLLEVDFSPGDLAVLADVGLKNLADALDGPALAAQTPPGARFDVLTGGYPDTGENMGYKNIVSLVNELKPQYEHIVIDTQAYLTDNVVAALHLADTVLAVVEDDLAAAARTAGALEYLDSNKYADLSKVRVVVNKRRGKDRFISGAGLAGQGTCRVLFIKNLSGYRDRRLLKAVSPLREKGGGRR
jgi:septum site-determining protein MinD